VAAAAGGMWGRVCGALKARTPLFEGAMQVALGIQHPLVLLLQSLRPQKALYAPDRAAAARAFITSHAVTRAAAERAIERGRSAHPPLRSEAAVRLQPNTEGSLTRLLDALDAAAAKPPATLSPAPLLPLTPATTPHDFSQLAAAGLTGASAAAAAAAPADALVLHSPCGALYVALHPTTMEPFFPFALNQWVAVHSLGHVFYDEKGFELPWALGYKCSFQHVDFSSATGVVAGAAGAGGSAAAGGGGGGGGSGGSGGGSDVVPLRPALTTYTIDTRLRHLAPSAKDYPRSAQMRLEHEAFLEKTRAAAEASAKREGRPVVPYPPPLLARPPNPNPEQPFPACPHIHARFKMGQPLDSRSFFLSMSPAREGEPVGFEGFQICQVWLSTECSLATAAAELQKALLAHRRKHSAPPRRSM
jgi:uncharacterized membrane protein YgcG